MRITALVKSHEHVCCRYRVAAFRPALEALGHHLEVRPWSSRWALEQLLPGFATRRDVFLIQRKLFPAWQLRLLRTRARRTIYDFDDSIFLHSSYNPLGRPCRKRFQQFRNMVQGADLVVAGNAYLRDQATAITEPAKVRLIPTCVNISRYDAASHDSVRPEVKLAWIGSASTVRGLERIRDLLNSLGRAFPYLALKVICDRSLALSNLRVEFCNWGEATEAADLADADIGISWLPDDAWSAGKCGLKVLQYMAAGLPVIANPVGVQADLVRHGETGFLVRTPDEWHEAVHALARDADLRRQMGRAGRRRVEVEFDVSRGAAAWQGIVNELTAVTTNSRT